MSENEALSIPFTPEALRANILRTWDRAQIERFALHLLGDEAQEQFGRPAAASSTAALDEAIRKAFAEAVDYQDEHGSMGNHSSRLVGQLEGLQMAKAIVQEQP